MTAGASPCIYATSEFVVPRSIPTTRSSAIHIPLVSSACASQPPGEVLFLIPEGGLPQPVGAIQISSLLSYNCPHRRCAADQFGCPERIASMPFTVLKAVPPAELQPAGQCRHRPTMEAADRQLG
jgi:hypothetical protein